jgi:hypothetical protein
MRAAVAVGVHVDECHSLGFHALFDNHSVILPFLLVGRGRPLVNALARNGAQTALEWLVSNSDVAFGPDVVASAAHYCGANGRAGAPPCIMNDYYFAFAASLAGDFNRRDVVKCVLVRGDACALGYLCKAWVKIWDYNAIHLAVMTNSTAVLDAIPKAVLFTRLSVAESALGEVVYWCAENALEWFLDVAHDPRHARWFSSYQDSLNANWAAMIVANIITDTRSSQSRRTSHSVIGRRLLRWCLAHRTTEKPLAYHDVLRQLSNAWLRWSDATAAKYFLSEYDISDSFLATVAGKSVTTVALQATVDRHVQLYGRTDIDSALTSMVQSHYFRTSNANILWAQRDADAPLGASLVRAFGCNTQSPVWQWVANAFTESHRHQVWLHLVAASVEDNVTNHCADLEPTPEVVVQVIERELLRVAKWMLCRWPRLWRSAPLYREATTHRSFYLWLVDNERATLNDGVQ